ncbi:hypothetical protein BACI348_41572 [Bacillus altitudinis]|uniref:Uncharacterized protein n=1 Tax=Bacillus altitudinis TaxID=293387 RepID=A0A653TDN4_BACAB|nr:hypothetical protein BACI348_41572 [Bacillus altitudinis]
MYFRVSNQFERSIRQLEYKSTDASPTIRISTVNHNRLL